MFVSMVRKCPKLKKLDAAIVREFIDKIFMSAKCKKSKAPKITIDYFLLVRLIFIKLSIKPRKKNCYEISKEVKFPGSYLLLFKRKKSLKRTF